MKRIIAYVNGRIYDRYFLPEIKSLKKSSLFLAKVQLKNGRYASVMSDPFGIPFMILKSYFDINSLVYPTYNELNELCEEQTYSKTGQSYRIRDLVLFSGISSHSSEYCDALKTNLSNKNITVIIDDPNDNY